MTLDIVKIDRARGLAPEPTTFTAQFWDALAQGRFRTTRCASCETLAFPPRRTCTNCGDENTHWETLSGAGRLYAKTRIHAGLPQFGPGPVDVAIIDLDEDIRLVCALLEFENVELDEPVELVVLSYDDGVLFGARRAQ